jgi:fructooligosaccharide transport system substrate-binding protein
MEINRRNFGLGAMACAGAGAAAIGATRRAAAQAKPTLTAMWWDWKPWNETASGIFADFKEKFGSEVRMNLTPFEDLNRSARTIPQQPNKPDFVLVTSDTHRALAALGILRPLDDVFTAADIKDFLPVSRVCGAWKGKFYGPAMEEASQALYYNREIIDRHGVKPPTNPSEMWTWPQAREIFIEVQAKERERRKTDRFWALNIGSFSEPLGGGIYNGMVHIVSNGERGSPTFNAVSDDGLTTDGYLNTPEALEAFTFMQGLFQKDKLLPFSTTTDLFPNEQVAFWHGNMSQRYYMQQINPNLKWGVTFLPYHKTPNFFTNSFVAGVIADAPNADLAAKAVQFLANPENGLKMALGARDIPLRHANWANIPEYHEPPLDLFVTAHEKWSRSLPLTPGLYEMRTVYQPMQADICNGAPVKDTVNAAVAKIDNQLKRYASLMR